jgi:hypothetical protein
MSSHQVSYQRRLHIEPLEDRRLLAVLTVNTTVDENNGTGVGGISLRDAVAAAAPGDTIEFAPSLTSGGPATILLTHGEMLINKNLTINGPGAALLTIDARGSDPTPAENSGDGSRIFRIGDNNIPTVHTVDINDVTLTGGDASSDGGAIQSFGALTVDRCVVRDNYAIWAIHPGSYGGGGGIAAFTPYVSGGTTFGSLAIQNSTIEGNSTEGSGGGVFCFGLGASIESSVVQSNTASVGGGGILCLNADLFVNDCLITQNSAAEGGGIDVTNNSDLTISNSEIRSNTALRYGGGVYANFFSAATIETSIVADNVVTGSEQYFGYEFGRGGGLFFDFGFGDPATIVSSTISGNRAGQGGGIYAYSTPLQMERTTISSNIGVEGGGIWAEQVDIVQSTISGNTASGTGGGIFLNSQGGQSSEIAHATIAYNSANIGRGVAQFGGALLLDHSIVSNGTSEPSDVAALLGGSISARFSLIGSNRHSGLTPAPVGMPDASGNLIGGTSDQFIDPKLGTLFSNGGPTQTHALLAGSPAIDAGDSSLEAGEEGVPEFDQRGAPYVRVASGRIDIGAVEQQMIAPLSLFVDTLVDEDDENYSLGDLSLREALRLSNERAFSADVISFAPSLTADGPQIISLSLGMLTISDTVTVNGPGAALLTIDASANDPTPTDNNGDGTSVFDVTDSQLTYINVFLDGLTLTGADGSSGAINSLENLTVTNSVITGNSAKFSGGGIFSNGVLIVQNCTISGNTANGALGIGGGGGGILASSATISDSTISGNSARYGGGLAGNFVIFDSSISGNSATANEGGGISGTATLTRSTVSGNTAVNDGGGIFGSGNGTVTLDRSTVSGNVSGRDGGGINGGSMIVRDSLVAQNTANRAGGGINIRLGHPPQSVLVTNSTISGNTATTSVGGGIHAAAGPVMIRHSTITNNSAGAGRGVATSSSSTSPVQFYSSIVSGNGTSDVSNFGSSGNRFQSLGYNIVGVGSAFVFVMPGDQHGVTNAMLGPLADNGGPTKTHALLAGSPAINMGDPSFNPIDPDGNPLTNDSILFDQRGEPFARVHGGRSDVGAFELQPMPAAFFGDYNQDTIVDAADYVVWRNTFGATNVPLYSGADGNGDGVVDGDDLVVWKSHFGMTIGGSGSGNELAVSLEGITPSPIVRESATATDLMVYETAPTRSVTPTTAGRNVTLPAARADYSTTSRDAVLSAWSTSILNLCKSDDDFSVRERSDLAAPTPDQEADLLECVFDKLFPSKLRFVF